MNSKQDKISTMSEIKDFKEFPTRDDYFANVISENKYYADKSLYLKSVFEMMVVRCCYLLVLVDLAKPC